MSSITSVGIVGCGWLGKALAIKLKALNISVMATRSTVENAAELTEQNINCKVLNLPCQQVALNDHDIFNNQCLIISITPQIRHGRDDYAKKVYQLLIAAKESTTVEKIILLSSTAVYNGLTGEVNEGTELDANADKVALLNQAEKIMLSFNHCDPFYDLNAANANTATNEPKRAYILRLSGLVGPNRHPGKFLVNDRMFKHPDASVNLIHQQDAVGLILSLLESGLSGGFFNGVSETIASKKDYYQSAAKTLDLPAPKFEEYSATESTASKIVSGGKAQRILNYQFVYPDLLQWLNECDSQGITNK